MVLESLCPYLLTQRWLFQRKIRFLLVLRMGRMGSSTRHPMKALRFIILEFLSCDTEPHSACQVYLLVESEWTPGAGDGQGGLAYCDSWGCKELDTTERLNWTELNWFFATVCFRLCYWLSHVWIFVTPWTELSCHKLLLLLLFSC